MTLYSALLFLHLAASLVLFAALSIEFLAVSSLRRTVSAEHARLTLRMAGLVPRIAGPSALVILLSGGYLSANIAAWHQGWIQVALLTVVGIAIVGVTLSGRQMRALQNIQIGASGEVSSVFRTRSQNSLLLISICLRGALLFGIVFLMAAKPAFGQSLLTIACFAAFGLLFAFIAGQRQKLPSAV